jgi:hypothetical protein
MESWKEKVGKCGWVWISINDTFVIEKQWCGNLLEGNLKFGIKIRGTNQHRFNAMEGREMFRLGLRLN